MFLILGIISHKQRKAIGIEIDWQRILLFLSSINLALSAGCYLCGYPIAGKNFLITAMIPLVSYVVNIGIARLKTAEVEKLRRWVVRKYGR